MSHVATDITHVVNFDTWRDFQLQCSPYWAICGAPYHEAQSCKWNVVCLSTVFQSHLFDCSDHVRHTIVIVVDSGAGPRWQSPDRIWTLLVIHVFNWPLWRSSPFACSTTRRQPYRLRITTTALIIALLLLLSTLCCQKEKVTSRVNWQKFQPFQTVQL